MSVRMATHADIPRILEIYRPYVEKTAISFEYVLPTLEEFTRRFAAITQRFPWLVWEEQGQVLGYAYGSLPFERAAYQWCAEASVYLVQEARGRGIGRALYQALEALLTKQGYCKVYALITTANQSSVDFHTAMGYQTTCCMPACGYKLGEWHGVLWMEKCLRECENPGKAPVSLPDIEDLPKILYNFQKK